MSPYFLHKSNRLNNTMFTEIQRKRKSNICQSLGKNFKPSAKGNPYKNYLFHEKTMKRMNQDLNTIQDRYKSKNFNQPSENWAALTRPRRAGVTGTRATNNTTNGKSTNWGKRNFSNIWHQYNKVREVCE